MKSNIFNRTLPKCVLTILAALAFVGCSDYDNGFTEQQISFIKNFKEIYGEVDPTQDWNLAERANVTVTTSQPSNIKIYTKNNNKYKIVGDYKEVMGTRTLGFDVVEGTKDIMVSNGTNAVFTTVGESVSFEGTRSAIKQEPDDNHFRVSYADGEDGEYVHFSLQLAKELLRVLPEDVDNLNNVTQDFYFVSQGPFTIYPLYRWTSSYDVLGIYWKDDIGEIHLQDIYRARSGGDLALYYKDTNEYKPSTDAKSIGYEISYDRDKDDIFIASKGITIDIPEGTEFGFYLDVYDNLVDDENEGYRHTVYSQSGMNKAYSLISPDGTKIQETSWKGLNAAESPTYDFGATFTSTVDGVAYKFFCFEDWNIAGPDLNDMVFVFGRTNVPVTVDEDAPSWIISAEDLGNTLDIDYNDVVIEVEHIFGQDELYVTPLAAGGTLASFVYFNDQLLGEIHQMLGDNTTTVSGEFQPINVFSTKPTEEGDEIVITGIPDGFTLTEVKEVTDENITTASTMGGFKVLVVPSTLKATEENAEKQGQTIQNALTEDGYKAPFVICTPKIWVRDEEGADGMAGHYRWPMENVPMKKTDGYGAPAYDTPKHSFAEWVANKSEAQDWYKYPDITITCAPSIPLNVDDKTATVKKIDSGFNLLSDEKLTIEIGTNFSPNAYNEDYLKWEVIRQPYQSTDTITITSSNESVVEIADNGQIKAVGVGTAVITIHLKENNYYNGADLTVTITVTPIFRIATDEWGGNAKIIDVMLLPNKTYQINLYKNNTEGVNDNVTYASSDETVAKVSANGLITAQKVGNATITVTSAGTENYEPMTATVNVTVPDFSEYGTPFTSSIGNAGNYSNAVSTAELPTSGTIVVTYLMHKDQSWGYLNSADIKGLIKIDDWNYNKIDFSQTTTVSKLSEDSDEYYVVSIEIQASEYSDCNYIYPSNKDAEEKETYNGYSATAVFWKTK